jgi:hypothetical protein
MHFAIFAAALALFFPAHRRKPEYSIAHISDFAMNLP